MEEIKKILEENKDNFSLLRSLVSEVNNWDGSLDYLEYYENDEDFFDTSFEGKPMEAVRATFYGDYRYSDEFVRFDGYGNLESISKSEYIEILSENADEIIERVLKLVKENSINIDFLIEDLY